MSSPDGRKLALLVVTRRREVAALVATLAERAERSIGRVVVVADRDEAVRHLRAEGTDAVLVDLGSPASTSGSGARRDRPIRVPVVAIHDDSAAAAVADALWHGADEVLSMADLNPTSLVQAIRTAVVRHRRTRLREEERDRDPVTGLCSRRVVIEELEARLAARGTGHAAVAVLLVDLDRFKLVNDTFGHAAGDDLLRAVADRLRKVVRSDDPLARLGGDEFCIVMSGTHVARLAPMIGHRVTVAMSEPFRLAGHSIPIRASVGIAVHEPGDTLDDLLAHADAALYSAKAAGRNRVASFDAPMRAAARAQAQLTDRLGAAIRDDRLEVRDAVLVDLTRPRMVGHLMAAGWEPGDGCGRDLVELARAGKLAPDLGRWLVAAALRRRADDVGAGDLLVSLPPGLLVQPTFCAELSRMAREHRVDPTAVVLLMSEADFDETDLVEPVIAGLASEGFGIGVDDFGAGRSSLALFASGLVDYVRLAPRLTVGVGRDPGTDRYLRGLVDIADAVGQHLIATATDLDEMRALRALGCHLAVLDPAGLDPAPQWELDAGIDLRPIDVTHPSHRPQNRAFGAHRR